MRIENFKVVGTNRPSRYNDARILEDIKSCIDDIENRFGPAVEDWALEGVRFDVEGSEPCIYYPSARPGKVMIILVGPATDSRDFARFQMAHELVHCLQPSGGTFSNVLEEGAAAWFQQHYATVKLAKRVQLGSDKYIAARRLYNKFVKKSKIEAPLRRLRTVEPYLHKITHDTFTAAGIVLPTELESLLLTRFEEVNPI